MILITGATGRVGRELVEELQKSGKYGGKIRILVRDAAAAKRLFGKGVQIYEGDLGSPHDFIAIAEACKGVGKIVHCAAAVDYSLPEK